MMKTVVRDRKNAESVVDNLLSGGIAIVTMAPVDGGFEVVVVGDNEKVAKELFPLRKWVES